MFGICILIVVFLMLRQFISSGKGDPEINTVSRGQVAKAVSLLFHTKEEIEELEDTNFKNIDKWYVDYVNMMYKDTLFTKNQIKPNDKELAKAFTYGDLDNLYTNMGVVDKKLKSYVNNNKDTSAIKMSDWNTIYKDLIVLCGKDEIVKEKELIVAGTISNVPELKPWIAATSEGNMGFDGLTMDYYIDKTIKIIYRDSEIISVVNVVSDKVTYENAWVESVNNGSITAFTCGVVREFIIEDADIAHNNVIADIVLNKNKIESFNVKDEFIAGKVLSISDKEIEIDGYGKLPVDSGLKVYSISGKLQQKTKNDIMIGYDVHRFAVSDGKICGAVIDRNIEELNIRVLLMNSGYKDIFHEEVILSCEGGFSVKSGNSVEMYNGEEKLSLNKDSEYLKEGRITIVPNSSDSKILFESVTRGGEMPSYRGSMDINLVDGKLIVINELSLEEYLYGVVPSEVPWSYNEEALKAQAVCARTYAYRHMMGSGYSMYGAHVDDSTRYQVYNNSGEHEITTKAVDDTKGIILTYKEEPISAYFFSTSCGSTTNAQVWNSDLGYIKGKLLSDENKEIDLREDRVFDTFIRSGYSTFDSEYPWYRWKVSMTLDEITKSVNENLSSVSGNVEVLGEDGEFEKKDVVGVGVVKKIETGTRNVGGVLDYVTIYGTENTIRVNREYNIRAIFDISGLVISRTNGEDVDTMSMLPSAYFLVDEDAEDGLLQGYTFVGGGYGHGAGMSQNGANSMGKNGYSYDKILKFYYTDIELTKIKK